MSIGVYGNIKGATTNPEDIDLLYCYSEDYTTNNAFDWKRIPSTQMIKKNYDPDDTSLHIQGSYTLSIPPNIIENKGYYSFLLQPKSFRATIIDCGLLYGKNIKGIVLDVNNVDIYGRKFFNNQRLRGFKIDYISNSGQDSTIENLFRIVTSNNYVEPVTENSTNSTTRSIRYKITNSANNLQFLTLSPSSSGSVKANQNLFIGEVGQQIILSNTYFDPIQIDIHATTSDNETLEWILCGSQVKDCSTGVRSFYNDRGEVFKQVNESVVERDGRQLEVRRSEGVDAEKLNLNNLR